MRYLKSKRGEADYITAAILVLVVVMLIALVINVFSVVIAKQKLDMCADQMTRQIQLVGEVNDDTEKLFSDMTAEIHGLTSPIYTVSTTYLRGTKIQLGTPFTVTVTAEVYIGGFGNFTSFPINIKSVASGVSEVYHK